MTKIKKFREKFKKWFKRVFNFLVDYFPSDL